MFVAIDGFRVANLSDATGSDGLGNGGRLFFIFPTQGAMIIRSITVASLLVTMSLCTSLTLAADGQLLANVRTQADLDASIAGTADPALKQALRDNAAAILAAADARTHVLAVASTVESQKGKIERVNLTPP